AASTADIVIGAGYLRHGFAEENSGILFDEGHAKFDYSAETRQIRLEKLDLLTADGRMVLAGHLTPPPAAGTDTRWRYDLNGKLRFTPVDSSQPAPLSDLALAGSMDPATGSLRIDSMNISWPDGTIAGRGLLAADGGMTLSGQIGEMPKSGLMQAWPPFVARDAREWLAANVSTDLITGGQFSLSLPMDFMRRLRNGGDIPAEAVSLDISARNMKIVYADGLSPIQLPDASASIRGRTLRVKAAAGFTRLPSGARMKFAQSDLVVKDLRADNPEAQIFMKVEGSAADISEYLQQEKLGYLKPRSLPENIKGRASGILRFRFPMSESLGQSDIKLIGKIRLENGAAKNVFGNMNVAGGVVDFDLTEKAVEANGDILVNGVPGKVRWLRLLNGTEDKQPPLRISAKLDAADRAQLGLNINHIVAGTIAADVTVVPSAKGPPAVTVQADLTQTEIGLDYLSWRKPVGKSAIVQFDVVRNDEGLAELQNFKVVGDAIAIDGWIGLGADNRVRKFAFPEFSVDVITRMEMSGELDRNDVWDVKVRASSFDGRPFFRNLFAPRRLSQHVPSRNVRRAGLTIRAFIKTMVGFSDTTLNDVRVVLQRRRGKLIGLEANGALDGGAPVAARIKPEPGKPRVLLAETRDAGRAFRLVGFYKNIRQGEAKLQVNLDQSGLADVSGILWTRNFYMLGDTVVNEVLRDGDKSRDAAIQGIQTRRDAKGKRRTVIEFDQLRADFSVGNGQFVLQKSFINGPALGATIRGKVDFERRLVNLGGTYVPLYGLNSALGSLPILGELLVSRRGEGILGITFGVQGRLDNPEVLVNPVSLVAPGIFRKIFEITPSQQTITPRGKKAKQRSRSAPKSSSAPAYSG
ncbi:MAG: AsmA-like C-terminal region-containing protein, partial [Hyphomicrobiaceae bacterium]